MEKRRMKVKVSETSLRNYLETKSFQKKKGTEHLLEKDSTYRSSRLKVFCKKGVL